MEEKGVRNRDFNCLVCDRKLMMNEDGRSACGNCNCLIFLNENSEPYIVKNDVPFNNDNFFMGIILIIGMIIFLWIKIFPLIVIAFLFLLGPFFGLFKYILFAKHYKYIYYFQNHMDLHNALINNRLKHYDLGSKFLVFSLFFVQFIGLLLILIHFIFSVSINW